MTPHQPKGGTGEQGGTAEDRLIARYFRPLITHPGAFGLADDAAVIAAPAGCDLVLTTDGVICGVHFFPDDPAEAVAKKVLRVNLSDLAAKGAQPLGFVLAIALPRDLSEPWIAAFAKGLGEDAECYTCPLLGGDTDRTPGPISASVTAFGAVPHGTMVRREGAKVGDAVVVSGTIGDAALGLRLRQDPTRIAAWHLTEQQRNRLIERYRLPQPRNTLAETLRRYASAAMDVSDGLAGDLAKLCHASQASTTVASAGVPLSGAARAVLAADPALMETILTGGDDYEVVATVPYDRLAAFNAEAGKAGVAVTQVGRIEAGEDGARFVDAKGSPMVFKQPSFSHF